MRDSAFVCRAFKLERKEKIFIGESIFSSDLSCSLKVAIERYRLFSRFDFPRLVN